MGPSNTLLGRNWQLFVRGFLESGNALAYLQTRTAQMEMDLEKVKEESRSLAGRRMQRTDHADPTYAYLNIYKICNSLIFQELVPIPIERLVMDRAHRALTCKRPDGPPCDTIVRLHFKEQILQAASKK